MSNNHTRPTTNHDIPTKVVRRLWFRSANVTQETLMPTDKGRQIGLIYALYRVFIAIFLASNSYVWQRLQSLKILEESQIHTILPATFEQAILGAYIPLSILMLWLLRTYKRHLRLQLMAGFLLDIAILTLFLYGDYAKDLQISLLYMVVVAASFMLLRLRHAAIIAFSAILSLVFQQVYYATKSTQAFLTLSDATLLSLSLIAVGFLSWSISQRLATAESAIQHNTEEIHRLNAINEEVIKNMVNGVIVIGLAGRVLVINNAASVFLRLSYHDTNANNMERGFELERILTSKYPKFASWYRYSNDGDTYLLELPQSNDSRIDKVRITKTILPEHGQLLILEDVSREQHHAQQLKLASLGQLTASIAHEIRNPLGAISQASQILMEDADDINGELYEMIFNQTKRVNRIIEDIIQLSRQEPPKQEVLDLKEWLPDFLTQHYPNQSIATSFSKDTSIIFDPSHLEQILLNLINNALRHTKSIDATPDVHIQIDSTEQDVLINVLDNGDGVSSTDLAHLFNPFFTKSIGGTGLGLYLSQAFSEANNSRLIYLPDQQKTCFRLITTSAKHHPLTHL